MSFSPLRRAARFGRMSPHGPFNWGANMAKSLFQRISPADFKSLLKKIAEAEKALADLRSELNELAGIKSPIEYQRHRPERQQHAVVLDDE
jgi:hypothetical protein